MKHLSIFRYCRWAIAIVLTFPAISCYPQPVEPLASQPVEEVYLDSQTTPQLQTPIDRAVRTEGIPGIVLYISSPETTWVGAAGMANLETKTPIEIGDRFRIGSITKLFVAVVILQLYEAGELTLDSAIADWLPREISGQLPNTQDVTIRQLLNHTSGFADYLDNERFFDDYQGKPGYQWTANEVLDYVYPLELIADPGEEFYYSNTNYILLDIIIEELTGNSLAQELRDRIYTPLGLNNTFMELQEEIPGGFVVGYDDWDGDGKRDNVVDLEPWGLGDGGIISTASDLATFLDALLLEQELLQPDSLDELLDFIDDGEGDEYGLGISNINTDWGPAWGHSGSTGGFLSTIRYLPNSNLTVVVLTNAADKGDPDQLAEEALEIVFGEAF